MGFIYKITNNINKKIYIGKTTKTTKERYSEHLSSSKSQKGYLYDAMRKHGVDNFCVETIEEVPNQDLNDREIFWIGHYKSNQKDRGYNCTIGGDGNHQIDIYTIEKINKLWNNGLTITDIAKDLSLHITTVKHYLETNCPTFTEQEQKNRGKTSNSDKHSKKVLQFDLNGHYIATYTSIYIAAKQLGIYAPRIKDCCTHSIPNVDAYQFIYEGDEHPNICINPVFTHKPVCQKDLYGNIVKMYISASAAAKDLYVDPSCIRRCCYGDKKTCKGFIWEFVAEMEYIEYIQNQ